VRLRNIRGSREVIAGSAYVVHEEEKRAGSWREIFGNDHRVFTVRRAAGGASGGADHRAVFSAVCGVAVLYLLPEGPAKAGPGHYPVGRGLRHPVSGAVLGKFHWAQ